VTLNYEGSAKGSDLQIYPKSQSFISGARWRLSELPVTPMFENVSAQGAWQGYQVSLCKSRPKCSPTRFLSKLTLSLNHGTCGLFLQLKNLLKVNNHPKCENSPNLAILGYIAKCRMLLGQVCKVGADLHESSLIRLWSSYIHMCKYI
jgi:hypothetical protein